MSYNGKRARVTAAVVGIFVTMVAAVAAAAHSGFVWNATDSVPLGIYRSTDRTAEYVLFCPNDAGAALANARGYREPGNACPDGYTPMLKPVVARAGARVTVSAQGVAVDGRLLPNSLPKARDAHGRAMRRIPDGTYVVRHGELWVISSYNAASYDSRYFGSIHENTVLSYVTPVFTF